MSAPFGFLREPYNNPPLGHPPPNGNPLNLDVEVVFSFPRGLDWFEWESAFTKPQSTRTNVSNPQEFLVSTRKVARLRGQWDTHNTGWEDHFGGKQKVYTLFGKSTQEGAGWF